MSLKIILPFSYFCGSHVSSICLKQFAVVFIDFGQVMLTTFGDTASLQNLYYSWRVIVLFSGVVSSMSLFKVIFVSFDRGVGGSSLLGIVMIGI